MNRYELYVRHIELAHLECVYGNALSRILNRLVYRFWRHKLNRLTINEAEEKLLAIHCAL